MNNDRELLELAARAAGYTNMIPYKEDWIKYGDWWNPLKNDGDAFRLAVNLRIDVSHMAMEVFAEKNAVCVIEPNDDQYAATRRAITRAAAEIGKTL